jgi:hypothetical protein
MSSNSNSENRDGNTGIAPPVTTDNMNAQFENVNIGTGESVATNAPVEESVGTSEPIISNAPMEESLAEEEKEDDAPAAAAEPSTGTKRGLSDKQSAVQKLRAETLDNMRAKYANRFGNSAKYPKPPKAKAPMAAKLTKIRQEQGESAYERAMKNMMDEDDPLLGTNGKSRLAMRAVTQRKKKANSARAALGSNSALSALNSRMNSMAPAAATAAPLTAQSRNASAAVVESIAEMGRTAKGLIDTMIQTSKEMARGLAKSGNTAALTNASNIAAVGANNARGATVAPASMSRGTRKKKSAARLPTIFENTGNTNYMSPSAAPAYNAPSSKGSRRSRAKPKGPAEPYVPYVNETPLSANI